MVVRCMVCWKCLLLPVQWSLPCVCKVMADNAMPIEPKKIPVDIASYLPPVCALDSIENLGNENFLNVPGFPRKHSHSPSDSQDHQDDVTFFSLFYIFLFYSKSKHMDVKKAEQHITVA